MVQGRRPGSEGGGSEHGEVALVVRCHCRWRWHRSPMPLLSPSWGCPQPLPQGFFWQPQRQGPSLCPPRRAQESPRGSKGGDPALGPRRAHPEHAETLPTEPFPRHFGSPSTTKVPGGDPAVIPALPLPPNCHDLGLGSKPPTPITPPPAPDPQKLDRRKN